MGTRVLIGFELIVEILERLPGISRQFGRHYHLNGGKQVAFSTSRPNDAAATNPEGLAALGSGRDLESHRPIQSGDVDLSAEGRFGERNRQLDGA